jgi:putative protein-disulfide isomerase
MAQPILWYFADPMCSWCWGFAPVMAQLRDRYHDRLKFALVLGGLRTGTAAPLSPAGRAEILHHWHDVQARTGQGFLFEGALPEGFVYDTEPACRAVACMADIDPALVFPMFLALQQAFYQEGRDVTQSAVLLDLALELGVEGNAFLAAFESDMARQRTQAHFKLTRDRGIRGFPTLVLQSAQDFHVLTNGWQALEPVFAAIEGALAQRG